MNTDAADLVFGPVPSRRLGRSLGVNNVPPKTCTYACVYCQLGPTVAMTVKPSAFEDPKILVEAVRRRIDALRTAREHIDYVTFVSDGEPTLDANLGGEIDDVRSFGVKTAVVTNGSLLWIPEVRRALFGADLVSVKVDAVEDRPWRRTDRPHKSLRLVHVLAGIKQFAESYSGSLITETMLVAGRNDDPGHVRGIARFVAGLSPKVAYLAIPTRPPAVSSVHGPDESHLLRAYTIFSHEIERVEYLIGHEGDVFSSTGDPIDDLLRITAVHPMREEAVMRLLERTDADTSIVEKLVREGRLVRSRFENDVFYSRRFS